jgi:hypothetical protein
LAGSMPLGPVHDYGVVVDRLATVGTLSFAGGLGERSTTAATEFGPGAALDSTL